MLKLSRYLKNYKLEAVLSPLFKCLEALFELLVPLVISSIIDIGIANHDKLYIYSRGLILLGFGIAGLFFAITAQYFSAKAAVGVGTELRNDLFKHIMSLSSAETDVAGSATLITRMTSDSNQIQNGVNMIFRLILRSPIIVFGALIMSYYVKGSEALIFLAVIAVLFIVVAAIMDKTVKLYRIVQKKLDEVLDQTSENLSGVRVIRTFCREDYEKRTYRESSEELNIKQIKAGNVSALMNPLTYVVINLGIVALINSGAINVSIGTLTQGEVVALVNYMSQILVELIKLTNTIILVSKAQACANRINEIFAMKNTLKDGDMDALSAWNGMENKNAAAISFNNVSFTYPNAAGAALSDINLTIAKGDTVGIIGGTGAGKTTLIRLISRDYDATSGSIAIAGNDIKKYKLGSLHRLVGTVQQKVVLFSGTIRDNILRGNRQAGDNELFLAAKDAQAAEIIEGREDGYESVVTQSGKNLSGGQKQRLSIARTLIMNSPVLILDDSSSALDFATDARLRAAIAKRSKDTTVIMVTQRVAGIANADKIIVMDDGRIAGIGTHKELVNSCELYREICLSQLSEEEVIGA